MQRSKSSKNRRKADRKLYSTREGSAYEDLGLMAEIHGVVERLGETRAEVAAVVRVLVDLGREQVAAEVQGQMEQLLEAAEKTIPQVRRSVGHIIVLLQVGHFGFRVHWASKFGSKEDP